MSISKFRESAREALTGKWGKVALITLVYLIIALAMGFIQGLFEENSIMPNLLGIAMTIIEVPMALGMSYAFIKLKRGEDVKAFEFLNMGFSNFGRAWKIALRTLLKMILPTICVIASIVLISVGITGVTFSVFGGTNGSVGSMLILILIALIILVASSIWAMVRGLLYSLTSFIAYDNPEMEALDVVNESAKMMNGNRGKIFLLELSFIGWAILAVFTLGIGYLWLIPYMQVALICFYEYLLGKNGDNSDVVNKNNDDNNGDTIEEL